MAKLMDAKTKLDNSMSQNSLTLNVDEIPNNVLQRLIKEVQHEASNNISAYNRTHSRHNRGR
jgi:hypothetical protein